MRILVASPSEHVLRFCYMMVFISHNFIASEIQVFKWHFRLTIFNIHTTGVKLQNAFRRSVHALSHSDITTIWIRNFVWMRWMLVSCTIVQHSRTTDVRWCISYCLLVILSRWSLSTPSGRIANCWIRHESEEMCNVYYSSVQYKIS
jgi:hypothetical protein